MSWLTRIIGGGLSETVGKIGDVVDKFHLSGEEKQAFTLAMEELLQKRDSEIEKTIQAELGAKERVLVAELTQGDNYTKRARPTVVYAGLAFIAFNYCLVPLVSRWAGAANVTPLELPAEFWYGWSGIVATWSVGRTMEKRGDRSAFTEVVTGTKTPRLLAE